MKKITYILLLSIFTISLIPYSAYAISERTLSKRIKQLDNDTIDNISIPVVLGVTMSDLNDTWDDARSGGRTHEGIDIFAVRGAIIATPTEAVVTKITNQGLGGVQVWTVNPGNERFYYAHLSSVFPKLEVGDILDSGDIIGFVGNTGNALGASPHLHLGIYTDTGPINPYERIDSEFSKKQRIKILTNYLEYLQDELEKAKRREK